MGTNDVHSLDPAVHDWQVPPHAVVQHTLSMQLLLVQSPAPAQPCPGTFLQAPFTSQAVFPVQLSGSAVPPTPAPFSVLHTPGILPPVLSLHCWQMPLHAVSQHTPSTQKFVSHCEGTVQGAPPSAPPPREW